MIGKNELVINPATMQAAVEYYLTNVVFTDAAKVHVVSVKPEASPHFSGDFVIELVSQDEQTEATQ